MTCPGSGSPGNRWGTNTSGFGTQDTWTCKYCNAPSFDRIMPEHSGPLETTNVRGIFSTTTVNLGADRI
jgi:hypothetical protein